VAAVVTSVPKPGDITRAEKFTREAFVHAGETTEDALGRGTARRRALDAALLEIDAGAKIPSPEWRRRYSLMLGLERVLSDDEPKLADGTSLNPHQVDALSGTLTALLAEAQRNGHEPAASAAPVLAVDDEPDDYEDDEPAPAAIAEDDDELNGDDDDDDDEPEDLTPLDIEIDIGDEDDEEEADEEEPDEDGSDGPLDEDQLEEAPDDPNAHKRFWFEHATGAGKTVAAMGFVDASRTGGVLILTHRRNLVDQFHGELKDRGYAKRITPALLQGQDNANGPVTVETYQWFVRNAGTISEAYSIVICDEAHTALGEKTSAAIRKWTGPIFIGMTATGALIARHVTDLFPTQTSRFDLAQAARRGVISPLRCVRIPPGVGVKTIAKVPLRRGEVDVEFDQEMLAELLDQGPFNFAAADLYKTRFNGVPGVIYAAGVKHAYNLAEAFREQGVKAMAVSGETRKRDLAEILARYERGDIDVLVNAQLLAEGWNSPRATVCMHLAPTASKRIYQQRVGRVTRRNPGKEAGIVVDFVSPDTKNDDPVVTLHSLLDRDVYRGGAIVVGPVRRGRGRRLRVERRVLPVTAHEDRRIEVFERELWRIAVEHLPYGEQIQWAALAGARVAPSGWRRARAMLHFDREGAIKRAFLLTAVQRNKNPQLRVRALQEIAASRDGEAFDSAIDEIGGWTRDERREGTKVMLLALAEKRIGRRDQANAWIWRLASYTRDVHEEYAVQRWPETKRLLGLLVNSSGAAHARNARRLVHAARKQDRRLSAALLAAAIAHTPEGEEILRGARTRLARKPSALSRELLRNFPKARGRRGSRRRRKKGAGEPGDAPLAAQVAGDAAALDDGAPQDAPPQRSSRRSRSRNGRAARLAAAAGAGDDAKTDERSPEAPASRRSRSRNGRSADGAKGAAASADSQDRPTSVSAADDTRAAEAIADVAAALAAARGPRDGAKQAQTGADGGPGARSRSRRSSGSKPAAEASSPAETTAPDQPGTADEPAVPQRRSRRALARAAAEAAEASAHTRAEEQNAAGAPAKSQSAGDNPAEPQSAGDGPAEPKPRARRAGTKPAASAGAAVEATAPEQPSPADAPAKPKPRARRAAAKPAAGTDAPTELISPEGPNTADAPAKRKPRGAAALAAEASALVDGASSPDPTLADAPPQPKPRPRRAAAKPAAGASAAVEPISAEEKGSAAAPAKPKPRAQRATAKPAGEPSGPAEAATPEAPASADAPAKPKPRARRAATTTASETSATPSRGAGAPKPRARRAAAKPADGEAEAPKPRARRTAAKPAASEAEKPKPRAAARHATASADAGDATPRRRAPAQRAATSTPDDAGEPGPVDGGVESAA
jgi:superfamily II DNA or RNA helicase